MNKRIALLSEGTEVEPTEGAPADTASVSEVLNYISPNADINEAAQVNQSVQDTAAAIDDAAGVSDVVEKTAGVLTGSEEEIPQVAAEAMNILLKHIQKGVGVPDRMAGFAMESLSNKDTKITGKRLARESLGDVAGRIWESIKAAFRRMINWIKDFYQKLFGANAKVKRAATSLKDTVEGLKNTPAISVKRPAILSSSGIVQNNHLDVVNTLYAAEGFAEFGDNNGFMPFFMKLFTADNIDLQEAKKKTVDFGTSWTNSRNLESTSGYRKYTIDAEGGITIEFLNGSEVEITIQQSSEVIDICTRIEKLSDKLESSQKTNRAEQQNLERLSASIDKKTGDQNGVVEKLRYLTATIGKYVSVQIAQTQRATEISTAAIAVVTQYINKAKAVPQ